LEHINNDRPTHVMLANLFGHADITESNPMSPDEFLRIIPDTVSADWATWKGHAAQAELRRRENSDTRDTTTPAEMVELLDKLWQGQLLKSTGTDLLFDIMYRCLNETGRLKGLLPPGSPVAHKPGEMLFSESDVGVIDLPHGAGHVAAAVYTKDSYETAEKQTELIAHLARGAFDYFTFTAMGEHEDGGASRASDS
jgi:beta-lactamase class A